MRIGTRNLLAELILGALDEPITADVLRCLAHYCRSDTSEPVPLPIASFLAPTAMTARQRVMKILQHHELLQWQEWSGTTTIALHPLFKPEYREIAAKLASYVTALDAWYLRCQPSVAGSAREAALRKGTLLFNHHLFFEVHEILEAQWKEESGDVRLFLQGLIQVAVAFHHLGNDNFRGAAALLRDGLAKIAPHRPAFLGLELQTFATGLERCQQALQRLGPEHFRQFPLDLIPSLQFLA